MRALSDLIYDLMLAEEANKYEYLCWDSEMPGVDDQKSFHETVNALTMLGFSDTDKKDIFYILSSILFLGNVQINDNSRGKQDCEASFIKVDTLVRSILCEILRLYFVTHDGSFRRRKMTRIYFK